MAVVRSFGADIDFGQLVKLYGNHPNRYLTTPATAEGTADHVWTIEEISGLLNQNRGVAWHGDDLSAP